MRRYLSLIAGVLTVVCYVICTSLAISRYPGFFSPLENWLSNLGSKQLNPHGALFYNLGIVLSAGALAVFFFGLETWKLVGRKPQQVMLLLTRLLGWLGAAAMLTSGLFPITLLKVHSLLSTALYILLGTAFAFSVAALRYYKRFPRWILAAGLATVGVDLLWSAFNSTFVLEWFTVTMFLGYVLILGAATRRKDKYTEDS